MFDEIRALALLEEAGRKMAETKTNKITAIKIARFIHGYGLKEAKDFVEAGWREPIWENDIVSVIGHDRLKNGKVLGVLKDPYNEAHSYAWVKFPTVVEPLTYRVDNLEKVL